MKALEEIIRREISAHGAIPFARFMELALYHPEHGYYEREESRIGRHGDYFTSVSVGSLFGELLAFQIAEWLAELEMRNAEPGTGVLHLMEAGAHNGNLARDILAWLREHRPGLFARLEYGIVEPSLRRQAWQRRTLAEFGDKVCWLSETASLRPLASAEDPSPRSAFRVPRLEGVIFSNELLDALPVHRLGWDARERRWFEWGVEFRDDRFAWTRLSGRGGSELLDACNGFPGHCRLDQLPEELLGVLPDGFALELCPQAVRWWRDAAQALAWGRLVTFDYGTTAEEWLRPERAAGTLRAYRQHHVSDDLLANVGEQDLTAHVNFAALQAAGEAAGLRTEGLLPQGQFLVHVLKRMQDTRASPMEWTPERTRQFHTLIHPDHLGRAFRVLVQAR